MGNIALRFQMRTPPRNNRLASQRLRMANPHVSGVVLVDAGKAGEILAGRYMAERARLGALLVDGHQQARLILRFLRYSNACD